MQITHIDHVTLIVTDVAKARAFYGDILGLKEIAPPAAFDFVAIWYDLGGQYLHLLLKPVPDSLSPRHVCFHVDDIGAAREHFRKWGIGTDETVTIPGCDRFFIRDPDGNRIEILHWQEKYNSERDGRISA
jgi:catechol 2,3-dioxygenase-like lactoylglutathione lyase family enzyme